MDGRQNLEMEKIYIIKYIYIYIYIYMCVCVQNVHYLFTIKFFC